MQQHLGDDKWLTDADVLSGVVQAERLANRVRLIALCGCPAQHQARDEDFAAMLAVSLHALCNSINCPALHVTLPSACHAAFCFGPDLHSYQYSERMKELNSPAGLPASWPW